MSPRVTDFFAPTGWWNKTLHLDIGRTRITLRDGKTQTSHELSFPMHIGIPAPKQLKALQTSIETLCATRPHGRRTLEITLSDMLARCWILERLPGLRSLGEIEALAADQMQQIYGDSAETAAQWAIRVDVIPFASRWPVVALPKTLLDVLLAISATHGWSTKKIQTRFVAGVNARRSIPFGSSKNVYSLATADGLTIGIRNTREWLALRSHPPLNLLATDLPTMLRRDCGAAGINEDEYRIHVLPWSTGKEVS